MKAKILIAAVILASLVWVACSKDKYTTTPQLVFKGMNGNEFVQNELVNFNLQVTDKEGDLQDSMIFVQRISLVCPDLSFTESYPIPSNTPKTDLKADVDVTYIYGNPDGFHTPLSACSEKTDTAYFKFWIRDNAGHTSDTVESPKIVLLK